MVAEATEIIGKTELISAFVIMGTVITALWGVIYASHKQNIERLGKYEGMHEESSKEIKEITGDYRELKGRVDGVTSLSESVLREIRELKK